MPRALSAVLALVVAVLVVLLLWQWRGPGVDPAAPSAPPTTAGADRTEGTVGAADAAGGAAVAPPERIDVTPEPPVTPTPFEVRGLVLGDRRRPQLADLRIVAYRGLPTDSATAFMSGVGSRDRAPVFVLRGEPIASAAVDNLGNFVLRSAEPHLRLTIEHDLYLLTMPTVVHLSAAVPQDDVVLAPILGACIEGQLFGEHAADITALRALLEPDIASVIRDPNAFMASIFSFDRLRTEPDAERRFRFTRLIPGTKVVLMAEGPNAFAFATQPPLIAGETREVALPVQAAASLRVKVVDEQGAGIEGARVTIRALTTDAGLLPQLRERGGATGADGTCTVPSLQPTPARVEAMARGYTSAEATIDLVAGDEPQQLELRVGEGGVVTGTVTDVDGRPLAGAHVAHHPATDLPVIGDMTRQLGADYLKEIARHGVETDAEGHYRLTGLEDEDAFHVVAARDDFAAAMASDVHMGDTGVDLVLTGLGTITGRVVAEETDEPIASFSIRLVKTMYLFVKIPVREEAITSADGSFTLATVPPDDYALEIEAIGRGSESRDVTFADGACELGTIRLQQGACVRGVVQDEDGAPVRGALVRRRQGGLADNPVMAMFGAGSIDTHSDAEGRFELGPLPAKRLQLTASADGYASGRSERIALESGQVVDGVVITLGHGGAIEGRLLPGAGNQVHDFMLLAQHQQTQRSHGIDPAPDGTFRVDNLDPGPYVVQAMPADVFDGMGMQDYRPGRSLKLGELMEKISSSVVSQRCSVRAGETSTVELDAGDLVVGTRWRIEIEVGGRPLANGIFEATSAETGRLRATMFRDGVAVIGNIEPGSYEGRVRSGLTLAPVGAPQPLVFPAGQTEHTTRISLPGGELRGVVLDANTGRPLNAALVRLLHEDSPEQDDQFGMALTNSAGEFTFPGLPDGTYGVVAAEFLGENQGAASQRGITIQGGAASGLVELRARPAATASVVVTDAGGAPILGATVLCVDAAGQPLGSLGLATTDAAGRAWFGGMPRGAARVVGRAPGRAPGATEVRELDPTRSTEFLLTLASGAQTTVQAVDRLGRPLVGATLSARCDGGPWLPAMLLIERKAAGTFDLGRLGPGTWEFRVTHPQTGVMVARRAIGNEPAVSVLVTPE